MYRIEPVPTPEEAAAIAAVIARLQSAKAAAASQPETQKPALWSKGEQPVPQRRPAWGSWWR